MVNVSIDFVGGAYYPTRHFILVFLVNRDKISVGRLPPAVTWTYWLRFQTAYFFSPFAVEIREDI